MSAFLSIPTQNLPFYYFQITLSGTIYTLQLRFNGRMQRWILDIFDANGNPIALGLPVLINRSLTSQFSTLSVPPGYLFAVDNSQNAAQPTIGSFLTDHTLVYEDFSA